MAQAVGNLYVKLSANTAQFATGMKKAGGAVTGLAAKVRQMGPRISGGLATALTGGGAVLGVKRALSAAKEQIAQERKLAQVLKSTGGAAGFSAEQMRAYASELQNVTNFGDEVTLNAMSVMATFRNVTGENFKRSIALAQDMSTVFGTDLSRASMQLGKALNAPKEGISALTRVGITFSESQKEQIKHFTETNQLAKAQGIILDELANQVEGAAAASSDKLTQTANAFGDLAESIGMVIANLKLGSQGLPRFTAEAAASIRSLADVMGGGGEGPSQSKVNQMTQSDLAKARGDAQTNLEMGNWLRSWGMNSTAGLLYGDAASAQKLVDDFGSEQERRAAGDSVKNRSEAEQAEIDKWQAKLNEGLRNAGTMAGATAFGDKWMNIGKNMGKGYMNIFEHGKYRYENNGGIMGVLGALAKVSGGGTESATSQSISALSGVNAAEAGSAAAHALMADAQSPVIIETKKNGRTLREIRDKIDIKVAEVPA